MRAFKGLLGGVLLLCLLLPASQAAVSGSFDFPAQRTQLWLSSEKGTVPGASDPVPLLANTAPVAASASDAPLIPILEQLGLSQHEAAWYSATPWNTTRDLTGDIQVDLYFFLNLEATTRLHVQLDDMSPKGNLTELGQADQKVSVQNLLPQHLTLQLPMTGAHLQKGHTLRLLVAVDDIDVLTWLQYDSANAPSGISFTHRWLDTDHDGIPDDQDACPTEPDCDHDGQVDGGQTVVIGPVTGGQTGGSVGGNQTGPTTYYQYYLNGTNPPPFSPGGPQQLDAASKNNLELAGGGAMGIAGILVAVGGLFGRHPL